MSNPTSQQRPVLKILILGESGAGKTSLMNRYCSSEFSSAYKATIGADFKTKHVQVDGRTVTLQIWDTAGQERYQSLGVSFYRGSDAVALVYDVSRASSFKALPKWRSNFLELGGVADDQAFPFVVLGNKSDLAKEHQEVNERTARQWCEENGNIAHFRVSALDGSNVENAFSKLVDLALSHTTEEEFVPAPLDLADAPKSNSGCC